MAISGISFNITQYTPINIYTRPEYGSFFVYGYANVLYPFPNGFNYENLSQSERLALSPLQIASQLWNFNEQIGTTTTNFAQVNQRIALTWVKDNGVLTFSADTEFDIESGDYPPAYLFPFIGFDNDYKLEGIGVALYLDKQFESDISNISFATKTGTSSLKVTFTYQNSAEGNFTTMTGLPKVNFTRSTTFGNGYYTPLSWTETDGDQSLSGFQNFAWANGNQTFALNWTAIGNSDLENEVSFSDAVISNSGISQFFDTASGAFEAVSSVLSTQLIPGLSVGTLIAIPLCFSVVLFLIKVVKGD